MEELLNKLNIQYQPLEKILNFVAILVDCFIVVVLCIVIFRIVKKLIKKFFLASGRKNKLVDERKANTMSAMVTSISKYAIYFVGGMTILSHFGVSSSALVAIAGGFSVAFGLGAQDLVKDFLAGFFILMEDQFGVGDVVTIDGKTGTVEDITIRTTRIRDWDGTVHIVPNGSITTVSNQCKEHMNAIVQVDIDYKEDMNHVLEVLREEMETAAKEVSGLMGVPSVLGVTGLNESAVTVRIVGRCQIKENYRIERELNLRIKNRLDKEGISIPFPQRTVHITKD